MIKEKYSAEFDFLGFYLPFTIVAPMLGIYDNYVLPLIMGAILLIVFLYLYSKVYFSKKWIKTKGKYKKYNLQYIRYGGFLSYISADNCCRPYCLYTYKVNEVQYTNDRLSILNKDFLEHEQFKKNAHYIIDKDIKTKEVTIYYNPKKPNESILVKGASNSKMIVLYSMLTIGLVSLAIGLYNCPCI